MPIISIVNQKGGVAKTTTTANVGAALAERGHRTLVMDLDPQANLTLGLGARHASLPYGLDAVLLTPDDHPLQPIVQQAADVPLFLVPGDDRLAMAERTLTNLVGSGGRVTRALNGLSKEEPFEWILLDCPPSLGRLTEMAIIASDYLIVPTEPKLYSFAGMDTLNRMIVGMRQDFRMRVQLLGVLITLYEKSTRLHRHVAAEISDQFGEKLFETRIHKNVKLSESELAGRPATLHARDSRGAHDYNALTDEILNRHAQLNQSIADLPAEATVIHAAARRPALGRGGAAAGGDQIAHQTQRSTRE